jgi:quercetin dioxygenase-like cupin family protein
MRRSSALARTAVITVVAAMSVLSTGVAKATPPTGAIAFKDLTRAQAMEGVSVPIKPGATLAMGSYSVAPGGATGWRQLPGATILAVNKGTMTVRRADGCGTKDYAAGQASVLPAGTYLVQNSGKEPLEVYGVFINQAFGAQKPLAEGPTAAAPAGCRDFAAASAPSGVSLTSPASAETVPGMFGGGAVLTIKPGMDVFADFVDFYPGFSTGWISHLPAVNIVTGGQISYVMARDGKCDTSESYHTGQGFYHPAHRHLAYNDGQDHMLLTSMYFNLPHEPAAPVIGNTTTAVDFTQAPPVDCPRLR